MRSTSLAFYILLVSSCGSSSNTPNDASNDAASSHDSSSGSVDAPSGNATDFSAPGSSAVGESTDSVVATAGCTLPYTLYTPDGSSDAPLVLLGHGFSRSQAQMVEIARHLASHGVRVATPDYCHLSATDSDHEANGADAAAMSAALANGAAVIHIGYSAGGLAAFLAASSDPNAAGYLGLDMVDAEDLALMAATSLSVPALGLLGEPSMCNSNGNGAPVYTAASVRAVRVNGASHCDFEEPTGGLCTTFCGAATGAVATSKAIAAAFVTSTVGLDSTGAAWIEPGGSEFDRLVAAGTITPL